MLLFSPLFFPPLLLLLLKLPVNRGSDDTKDEKRQLLMKIEKGDKMKQKCVIFTKQHHLQHSSPPPNHSYYSHQSHDVSVRSVESSHDMNIYLFPQFSWRQKEQHFFSRPNSYDYHLTHTSKSGTISQVMFHHLHVSFLRMIIMMTSMNSMRSWFSVIMGVGYIITKS